jgi:ankyrin repeat protein
VSSSPPHPPHHVPRVPHDPRPSPCSFDVIVPALPGGLFGGAAQPLSSLLRTVTLPFFLFKQAVSVVQMLTAARRILRIDEGIVAARNAAAAAAAGPASAAKGGGGGVGGCEQRRRRRGQQWGEAGAGLEQEARRRQVEGCVRAVCVPAWWGEGEGWGRQGEKVDVGPPPPPLFRKATFRRAIHFPSFVFRMQPAPAKRPAAPAADSGLDDGLLLDAARLVALNGYAHECRLFPFLSPGFHREDDFLVATKNTTYGPRKRTRLMWLAGDGNTSRVRVLLKAKADTRLQDRDGRTALHHACTGGNKAVAALLLAAPGADIEGCDKNGWTPLIWAAFGRSLPVLRLLVKRGANVLAVDEDGRTALHNTVDLTCEGDDDDNKAAAVAAHLLSVGVPVQIADSKGRTALYWAAARGYEGTARLLLDKGTSVDAADANGVTPLMIASLWARVSLVRLLLSRGADVRKKAGDGCTALHRAMLLVEDEDDDEDEDDEDDDAFQASVEDRAAIVRMLLATSGCVVNAADKDGYSPLHIACQSSGSLVLVNLLLAHGADLNALSCKDENMALHVACRSFGRADVAARLIERGALINVSNADGSSPLAVASSSGKLAAVRLLLDKKAHINARDHEGRTALVRAVQKGHGSVAELLLSRGANSSLLPDDGDTPLCLASRFGLVGTVRLLLERGADVNKRDGKSATALMWTSAGGHDEVVELLLARKADVQDSFEGIDALFIACEGGHARCAELLIRAGAPLNTDSRSGSTLLLLAIAKKMEGVAMLLLSKGVPVNTQGAVNAETPLTRACAVGLGIVAAVLIERGVDVNARTASGSTPLSLALSVAGMESIVTLLRSRGAQEPAAAGGGGV